MDLAQSMAPLQFPENGGPLLHPQWCTGGLLVLEPDLLGFKSPFCHLATVPLGKLLNLPESLLPPPRYEGNNATLQGLLQE